MKPKYYLTTPIYYVNGAPHIGHAYTSIAADVLARWKRLDSFDVFFLTGTDEHGQKVEKAAEAAGLAPQQFADQVSGDFRAMAAAMGVSNDDFIRTTEERHKRACAALWERLVACDQIYLGAYEGWYAVRDEAFYGEDELIRAGNSYIDRQAPWALKKTDFPRMETVLRVLAELLRAVATNLQPFMPGSMARMLDQLGVPEAARGFADLAALLPAGTALPAPAGVFPRFVEE